MYTLHQGFQQLCRLAAANDVAGSCAQNKSLLQG